MRAWRWEGDRFEPCAPPAAILGRRAGSALLLPPLWDHHGHILALGAQLEEVDLRGCASEAEALSRVTAVAAALPEGAWVLGSGWDQERWGGAYPTAALLQSVACGRPCYLRRIDGHAAWASPEALRRAGLDAHTPDPPGGRLLREAGVPTGILLDNAMLPVEAVLPALSPQDRSRRAAKGLWALRSAGLSGATDMGLKAADAEALAGLEAEGELPLPCDGFLWEDPTACPALWEHPGRGFRVQGVKLFADGALGSRGAALSEPYGDEPGTCGLLIHEAQSLREQVAKGLRRGAQVAVHAIGDAAADEVLGAVAEAGRGMGVRLEHAQVLRPDQVDRLAALGVTASLQPCHWLSDRAWAPARLGARLPWAYRAASLRRAGAALLLGTDFPIEPPDPRRTLYAALARGGGEALSFGEALSACAPPAWAALVCGATAVLGGSPKDLREPERLLSWALEALPPGPAP